MDIEAAKKHLRKCDKVMGRLVKELPLRERGRESDAWRALTSSIIGQQISVHAARSIRNRFAQLESGQAYPSPHFVAAADDEVLRGAGLSRAKVLAIRDLARHLDEELVRPHEFHGMADEAIIAALVPVRGIGKWTAEMFLIFALGREDVLAVDDLGLRNAIKKLYALESLSPKEMQSIAEPWRPYRSVASWYLWQSLDNEPK